MRFIVNGEPYLFDIKCSASEAGQELSFAEKKQVLIQNLLDIYDRCNMSVSQYCPPKPSFMKRLFGGSESTDYPDLCINNYLGEKGKCAYYYVMPAGHMPHINIDNLPEEVRHSYVKIIHGSVFCLEKQTPNLYIKGCNYASMYESTAVLPVQGNNPLSKQYTDKELAEIYADAWKTLDATKLSEILDKDMHYVSDAVFDDMSSRDEYIHYLTGKFQQLRKNNTLQRIQLGRNGADGDWSVLIKQLLPDNTSIVVGFFIKSHNCRISKIEVHEMDLPDF